MTSSGPSLKDHLPDQGGQSIAPSQAIQVRTVTLADYPYLARFLSTFADETRTQDFWLRRFHWWWEGNTAYQEEMPRGWILLDNNTITGYLGIVPTYVQLYGKTVTASNSTTWRILPTYRNHSLRLFYQALRFAKGSVFFNTTPTEDVARILRFHRFRLLPHSENQGKSVIVINLQRLVNARIRVRVLATITAWTVVPVVQALLHRRLRTSRACHETKVKQLIRADSSFDKLWLRTRHLYANTNVRSATAINWQCFANDDFRKLLFGCFRDEQLVGFLIATRGLRDGLRILSCLDIWLDPDAPSALPDLLRYVVRWAREEGLDLVEIPHFDCSLAHRLTALGLLKRSAANEQPAYYKIPTLGVLDPAASYFVGLQGDRGL